MNRPFDPIAIGRRIKERRTELGLSTTEVGAPLRERGLRGYSQQNIVTLEKGATQDPRRQVMDLAEVLYTSQEWLLYGTGTRETGAPLITGAQVDALPLELRQEITALVKERLGKKKRA
jgi:hypothetical protein